MPPWSPERKAAWKARMLERNNKPASGIPAGGPGWGGPANGRGSDKPAAPPIADPKAAAAAAHTPQAEAKRRASIASAEELKGVLSDIALNDKAPDMARIAAADKLLDRIEGKPVQKTELTGKDGGPLASVVANSTDPIEAAKAYQRLMNGA